MDRVGRHFGDSWQSETAVGFAQTPIPGSDPGTCRGLLRAPEAVGQG